MGWGFLEDAWDAASDAVSDAAGAVVDAAGSVGGGLGDVIAATADAVDTATFGLAGEALEAADDYVFDTVDYVTAGAVNLDFDDGRFTVGAGIDGVASVGASIGEHGITADGSVPGASFDLAVTDDGFSYGATAGIDFGPLPYVDGHIDISPDGDIAISGEIQGTLPTPVGLLSGEASGGFVANDEGWGVSLDAEGTLLLPSGTSVHGGVEAAYTETDDGSHLSVGVEGSVSMPGVGTAGGAVGYDRLEVGDDVVETVHVEASASGFGASVSAEADYAAVEVDGVRHEDWSADVDVELPVDVPLFEDVDDAVQAADAVETTVDDMFSDL